MTIIEARDILVNRLDFRVSGADPASGRYFEAENDIISVSLIKDMQETPNISDGDFTTYLTQMKSDCVLQVLSNVFDSDYIKSDLLTCYPSLFDDLISLSMASKVMNLILTSRRSGRNERISKDQIPYIYLELNGNHLDPNLPYTIGLVGRYKDELKKVRKSLLKQNKIRTITTGAVPNIYENFN